MAAELARKLKSCLGGGGGSTGGDIYKRLVAILPSEAQERCDWLLTIDRDSLADSTRDFTESMLSFAVLLHFEFKRQMNDAKRAKSSSSEEAAVATERITRETSILAPLLKCRSIVAKLSISIFVLNTSISSQNRSSLVDRLLLGLDEAEDAADFLSRYVHDRDNLTLLLKTPAQTSSVTQACRERIVFVYAMVSEIAHDRGYARIAESLDPRAYRLMLRKMITVHGKAGKFQTILPYGPLITRYLRNHVAPVHVNSERARIDNVFRVNAETCVLEMLDSVEREDAETTDAAAAKTEANAICETIPQTKPLGVAAKRLSATRLINEIDPKREYEVFIGPLNYLEHVHFVNIQTGGNRYVYHAMTYNDCLYDVRGCTIRADQFDVQSVDKSHYFRQAWSERLALMDYRAKIRLHRMSGMEILSFNENATITVSALDDDGFYSLRSYTIKPNEQCAKRRVASLGDARVKQLTGKRQKIHNERD